MALFGFKKKNEKKTCCCCGNASKQNAAEKTCCDKTTEGIFSLIILGAGCKSCHEQYEYAKEAVKNMGLDIEVVYITDMQKIMGYGVMSMPAIVVNEKVVAMGRVLKTAEVQKLLEK